MLLLVLFAFIGGVITILSPCILPLLPIILSSSVGGGKRRPFGIVTGFVLSFTFFTLFLSTIVRLTGIPADALRNLSVIILIIFGLTLVLPFVQAQIEKLFVYFQRFTPQNSQSKTGFGGGLVVGASLGLLWTPCVGPILASVISLALSGQVTSSAITVTLAYATGTAIPMFLIIRGGQSALQRVPWLLRNSGKIQKAFGVIMILTAIAIYFNVDRQFQSYVLEKFPSYGTGLTKLEDNNIVQDALQDMGKEDQLSVSSYRTAPEIVPGGEWLNSDPLTLQELRGKVVLIDFWTYSCINCIRTLPYLRDWWSKYKDDGLVIIGVHTPEFEFEKSIDNLTKAASDFGLTYPIVQDNNYSTWRAYNNHYWPAKYLIDKDGRVRYTHFGEGEYDQTEQMIQDLLSETGVSVDHTIDNPEYSVETLTPETYLGYVRMTDFASTEEVMRNEYSTYTAPNNLPANYFAFSGDWKVTPEYAEAKKGSRLLLNYYAKNVFLVLQSEKGGQVKVSINGQVVQTIDVKASKLYDIYQSNSAEKDILELEFLDDGIQAFAFTFG